VAKVETLLADAVAKGAAIACGGDRHARGVTFFEPTVVTENTSETVLAREEIFGPVAPLYCFETEQQAIRMANATEYGQRISTRATAHAVGARWKRWTTE